MLLPSPTSASPPVLVLEVKFGDLMTAHGVAAGMTGGFFPASLRVGSPRFNLLLCLQLYDLWKSKSLESLCASVAQLWDGQDSTQTDSSPTDTGAHAVPTYTEVSHGLLLGAVNQHHVSLQKGSFSGKRITLQFATGEMYPNSAWAHLIDKVNIHLLFCSAFHPSCHMHLFRGEPPFCATGGDGCAGH